METFGDLLLTTIWIFCLIAYLMVLFFILLDLFRDHKLSGWWKAVWIVFLFILPFLSALIYLIARGSGMQERAAAEATTLKQAQDEYIRGVAATGDPAGQIAKAKQLHDQGIISDDEFEQLKRKALS
ncbi:MAG: SHOCT domain-containing protein [Candidatus Nanopelagicales bacterium]|nr:SHOCT domain-containing protein [Candidatus Nanopelagicales bacterium]MDZ4249235.1 SHOCT domain-containing protein [Candidatus Nanopelagicales bacterium]